MSKNATKIKEIFTNDVISQLKSNKDLLTYDLLTEIRSFGNSGKKLAFELLDMSKHQEGYYQNSFGDKISYKGIITLKGANVKLDLLPIHEEEIQRCMDDIHYFMSNYCKIVTKNGTNYPELRPYQVEYLDAMVDEEAVVSLQSRQSGKSVVAGIYLLWLAIFKPDILIGIAANRNSSAKEILNKIKNIFLGLPIWMMPGVLSWNKTFVEFENGVKILTDSTNGDSFRGYTVNCLYLDEVAWVKNSSWVDFEDAVFPAQGALAWKKTIMTSTMKGLNHWYDIVNKAKKSDEYHFHEAKWSEVPRYNKQGEEISPESFMDSVINKYGILYFNQNYLNEPIGSSHTLISSDRLKLMESAEIEEMRDGKLNIYEYPIKNHKYIFTVDAAKDGQDAFAVQIVDITDFHFKQVATAKLQIDYLLMPEFINEWCELYNNPYLIIENNEGAGQSIADQMKNDYEYENLHYDKDVGRNKKKKYPGFRTTKKSRKQILQTLKLFIENKKITINDSLTINEFFQFILINNKYQADDGCHDDMIMSLALVFSPFVNSKNFEDMKSLVKNLYNDDLSDEEKFNFGDNLAIGNFDDGSDDDDSTSPQTWNGYAVEDGGSYI